jgi:hypothetical protein
VQPSGLAKVFRFFFAKKNDSKNCFFEKKSKKLLSIWRAGAASSLTMIARAT